MSYTSLSGCGSGSSGLFFQPLSSDFYSPFPIALEFSVTLIRTSGVLTAVIDSSQACYCWALNESRLIKHGALSVACGWTHVLILCEDDVFAYGKGSHGQLGVLGASDLSTPLGLGLGRCSAVSCGFRTSFALRPDATFVFGENHKAQLGLGHKHPVPVPTANPSLGPLSAVAGGNRHSLGFRSDSLFVWGANTFGQLGLDQAEALLPVELRLETGVRKVASGWNHSVVLMENGDVRTAGKGGMGQLGGGKFENCNRFRTVMQGVEEMESGSEHVLCVKGGKVYVWGWNEHGNLGTGDRVDRAEPTEIGQRAVAVAAGGAVSYFLC
jgi:alpha-tubulin suppressor-like RCC1 family protein